MGGLIAGVAVSTLASAISGYMGAQAQKEAYQTLAQASAQERAEFQKAYDQAYGADSYNAMMQKLGTQAAGTYYDMLNDESSWNSYINGENAYQAPAEFSFTAEDLYSDPSYQTRLNEGLNAVEQSLLSSGYSDSGRAAKAINNYAQEQASKEYANAYNRAYTKYTNDRDFDYNAWKNEANQYYANLTNRLSGLNNVSNAGAQASTAQANALQALANNNASSIQQTATANAAASQADTSGYTAILDAIAKGAATTGGIYASQAYATPSSTTAASSGVSNTTSTDPYSSYFSSGSSVWNQPLVQPTTSNLVTA